MKFYGVLVLLSFLILAACMDSRDYSWTNLGLASYS